ncbi:ACT domain-containing protein [Shewanella sp. cp20]|uniref:ACT domain-containing protein n=1 Tax=Shewanella sp. cp20 TaxID=1521167 RepID=UPI0005A1E06B|nr:ACT domain-containing protein [Shewanella sp. cp20]KIO37600.1 glycine cleavage system regulatory protein [Shewanella sp. cp20]
MNKMFVTTVTGVVTPGVVKAMANLTREAGGEWLSSKVIKMDAWFAAMMKVAIVQDKVAALQADFVQQFPELTFSFSDMAEVHSDHTRSLRFNVDCLDRPGLTREIVDILSNLDLEVEQMECNRMHVSTLGQTVFSAKLAVSVPEEISGDSIIELLENVSQDARVSLT